jgi:allantoin racemase
MRIWYQSGNDLEQPNMRAFSERLQAYLASIKQQDAEITLHGVTGRMWRPFNYVVMLNTAAPGGVFNQLLQAEREQYDAAALGCFSDPGLYEAREAIGIPVIGMGECSMLGACMLGRRFALVGFDEKAGQLQERNAWMYGLRDRMTPFCRMDSPEFDFEAASRDPARTIEEFCRAAERGVEAGADVIIPGCGMLDLILVKNRISGGDGRPEQNPGRQRQQKADVRDTHPRGLERNGEGVWLVLTWASAGGLADWPTVRGLRR